MTMRNDMERKQIQYADKPKKSVGKSERIIETTNWVNLTELIAVSDEKMTMTNDTQ
jgi:hypothetical protein